MKELDIYIETKNAGKLPVNKEINEGIMKAPFKEYIIYYGCLFFIVFICINLYFLFLSNTYNIRYKNIKKVTEDLLNNYENEYLGKNLIHKALLLQYFYKKISER